jgi:hypothetical protein
LARVERGYANRCISYDSRPVHLKPNGSLFPDLFYRPFCLRIERDILRPSNRRTNLIPPDRSIGMKPDSQRMVNLRREPATGERLVQDCNNIFPGTRDGIGTVQRLFQIRQRDLSLKKRVEAGLKGAHVKGMSTAI